MFLTETGCPPALLQVIVSITEPVIIEVKDLLEDLPWLVRSVSGIFVNPYYFRFDVDFDLEITGTTGTTEKAGTGIFEMMLLKGLQTVRE